MTALVKRNTYKTVPTEITLDALVLREPYLHVYTKMHQVAIYTMPYIILYYSAYVFAIDPCSSGDIRFIDNITEYEGHIEVCTDHGLWSMVSGFSWNYPDAVVACRQLGFTDSSKTCIYMELALILLLCINTNVPVYYFVH